jgi:hypothetical protein
MNPLQRYREAQQRARALFDPFTQVHCAACATPCCRKPVRVRPVDLILIEELGFDVPRPEAPSDLVEAHLTGPSPEAGAPCDWLTETGCRFPADLRPFGCVAFICEPMRRILPPEELRAVEAAIADLEAAHAELMTALHTE